jgi:hypothetical protein
MNTEPLFTSRPIHHVYESQNQLLKRSVESLTARDVSPENEATTCERLFKLCDLPCVKLKKDEIYTTSGRDYIRLSRSDAFMRDMAPGVDQEVDFVYFHVPFEGERRFFDVQPSRYNFNPPVAEVRGAELVFGYPIRGDAAVTKKSFEADLASVEGYLATLEADCNAYNEKVKGEIPAAVSRRREQLSRKSDFMDDLGFPRK